MAKVLVNGKEIQCGDVTLSLDEGAQFWLAHVVILDVADYVEMVRDTPFSVIFGDERGNCKTLWISEFLAEHGKKRGRKVPFPV
ncbi:MAG: hypothetical protein HQL73_13430 [Magnetococcales bacterium]|nr:hypothetical protein [Magnetococcales bacterium]